jgi:hypothetical protein
MQIMDVYLTIMLSLRKRKKMKKLRHKLRHKPKPQQPSRKPQQVSSPSQPHFTFLVIDMYSVLSRRSVFIYVFIIYPSHSPSSIQAYTFVDLHTYINKYPVECLQLQT